VNDPSIRVNAGRFFTDRNSTVEYIILHERRLCELNYREVTMVAVIFFTEKILVCAHAQRILLLAACKFADL
jgi:hypothetical protein